MSRDDYYEDRDNKRRIEANNIALRHAKATTRLADAQERIAAALEAIAAKGTPEDAKDAADLAGGRETTP